MNPTKDVTVNEVKLFVDKLLNKEYFIKKDEMAFVDKIVELIDKDDLSNLMLVAAGLMDIVTTVRYSKFNIEKIIIAIKNIVNKIREATINSVDDFCNVINTLWYVAYNPLINYDYNFKGSIGKILNKIVEREDIDDSSLLYIVDNFDAYTFNDAVCAARAKLIANFIEDINRLEFNKKNKEKIDDYIAMTINNKYFSKDDAIKPIILNFNSIIDRHDLNLDKLVWFSYVFHADSTNETKNILITIVDKIEGFINKNDINNLMLVVSGLRYIITSNQLINDKITQVINRIVNKITKDVINNSNDLKCLIGKILTEVVEREDVDNSSLQLIVDNCVDDVLTNAVFSAGAKLGKRNYSKSIAGLISDERPTDFANNSDTIELVQKWYM